MLALTVGLLAFLAIDAVLEGIDLAGAGAQAFGGEAWSSSAGVVAYLGSPASTPAISADALEKQAGAGARRLALLVALGIGLHNLGEGLAIGRRTHRRARPRGVLVVGFAIHNTTEGLAIVAPVADESRRHGARLAVLGLLAGAPASSAHGSARPRSTRASPRSCSASGRAPSPR